MEYLYGNEENFWNFVDSITSEDKIALLTHTDLDGISSGIFLEEILKSKNLNAELIGFLGIKPSMFEEISLTLEKEKINFVFITDIVADLIKGFREFCGKFNVFLIDHHPSNFENGGYKNILKSESADCVGEVMFNLGKQVINPEWGIPLVCATMVAEFSFKKKENLEFIQHYYPEAIEENIFESVPGVLSKKIAAALIYYSSNLRKVYDIIKERNFEELDEAYGVIETEIQKNIELFGEDAVLF